MKKILISGISSQMGGVETFVSNLCHGLNGSADIHLIVIGDKIPSELNLPQEIKVHYLPSRRNGLIKYKNNIKKLLLDEKFDVVWSNGCSLSDSTLIKTANKLNIKTIVYSHQSHNQGNFITGILHNINKRFIRKSDYFGACSIGAWEYFFKNIVPDSKINVFPNAVDPFKFKFNPEISLQLKKQYHLQDRFVLGSVGRLTSIKNHEFIIRLLPELKNKINEKISYVIIGEGELKDHLISLVKELDLNENVLFLGSIPNVNEWLNVFDLYVMPSLFEGLPFGLVEAQMNGLYCLASDKITDEIDFTQRVSFIPLVDMLWIQSILNKKLGYSRTIDENILLQSKFNLNKQINEFKDLINS